MQSSRSPVSFFSKRVCQVVSHYITPILNGDAAYPPVLLARKAKSIMKGLDAEKGPVIIVRTVFESEDRQCVPYSQLRSHSTVDTSLQLEEYIQECPDTSILHIRTGIDCTASRTLHGLHLRSAVLCVLSFTCVRSNLTDL